MSVPSARTIKRRLEELRTLIDGSKDPTVTRIAYGMEIAIVWATTDTEGWATPAQDAVLLASELKKELQT
jgi:hypothetical protein